VAAVGGEEQAAAVGGEEQATADSPWRGGRGCREGRIGSGGALCFFFYRGEGGARDGVAREAVNVRSPGVGV
jgi:hypothetical protein